MPNNTEARIRNLELLMLNLYDGKPSIWRDAPFEKVLQDVREESRLALIRKTQEEM